jgi:hypothetical protein
MIMMTMTTMVMSQAKTMVMYDAVRLPPMAIGNPLQSQLFLVSHRRHFVLVRLSPIEYIGAAWLRFASPMSFTNG